MKLGILTNGLDIPRFIEFFDNDFKNNHPQTIVKKSNAPDIDKEIGDSMSLKPVLTDFFAAHPKLSFKTFIGDSAFDSYDNHAMPKNNFGFERACIPINNRNEKHSSNSFDQNGRPICPLDGTPFTYLGKSGGKNRSLRFKWVCHCSIQGGTSRVCICDNPCTSSNYGKCVYTYPDKDFRLYPGIPRGTQHWDNLYRHRVTVERTINLLKDTFVLDSRCSHNSTTIKADTYLAAITQLLGVILADAIKKPELYKSIRKLIA